MKNPFRLYYFLAVPREKYCDRNRWGTVAIEEMAREEKKFNKVIERKG